MDITLDMHDEVCAELTDLGVLVANEYGYGGIDDVFRGELWELINIFGDHCFENEPLPITKIHVGNEHPNHPTRRLAMQPLCCGVCDRV